MGKAPKHLEGLISVIAAVEAACDGTDFCWLIRNDEQHGYYANITDPAGAETYRYYGSSPTSALASALTAFNLRIKKP